MKKIDARAYDIICIGDAGMDAYVGIHDASLLCNINKTDCWFCLNFAEKIPISELRFTLGGNGCNVAVGSARLGLKSAFYTIVGTDSTGKRILEKLEHEGVSLEYVKIKKIQKVITQSRLSIKPNGLFCRIMYLAYMLYRNFPNRSGSISPQWERDLKSPMHRYSRNLKTIRRDLHLIPARANCVQEEKH